MKKMDSPKKNKTELNLSIAERIRIVRSSHWFLLSFPFVMLGAIILFFGIYTKGNFFRPSVLKGILSQSIIIGTCATGVAFIYSNGNLDISIGAVMGLSATVGVLVYNATGNTILFVLVGVAMAVALMAFNCTLSAVFHIKTITVAIVVMQIYSAITTVLVGGTGEIKIPYEISVLLEQGGFRYFAFFGFFVFCLILYHTTKIGRELRFLGGNEICAKQTGMNNIRSTYISFLVTGIGVGFASLFSVIDVSTVSVETGNNLGMDVMLATVLGGMSIFGGSHSNTYSGLIGALTVVALNKGLLMAGVSSAFVQGIRGVIFLVLVYLNSERQELLPAREQF